jgi:hypothetical protein
VFIFHGTSGKSLSVFPVNYRLREKKREKSREKPGKEETSDV